MRPTIIDGDPITGTPPRPGTPVVEAGDRVALVDVRFGRIVGAAQVVDRHLSAHEWSDAEIDAPDGAHLTWAVLNDHGRALYTHDHGVAFTPGVGRATCVDYRTQLATVPVSDPPDLHEALAVARGHVGATSLADVQAAARRLAVEVDRLQRVQVWARRVVEAEDDTMRQAVLVLADVLRPVNAPT